MIKKRLGSEEFEQVKGKIWSPTKYVNTMLHLAKRDHVDPDLIDIWASYSQHLITVYMKAYLKLPAGFSDIIKKMPKFSEVLRKTIVSACANLSGKCKRNLVINLRAQGVPEDLLVKTGPQNRKGCWREM